jgi:hypothetical protein
MVLRCQLKTEMKIHIWNERKAHTHTQTRRNTTEICSRYTHIKKRIRIWVLLLFKWTRCARNQETNNPQDDKEKNKKTKRKE